MENVGDTWVVVRQPRQRVQRHFWCCKLPGWCRGKRFHFSKRCQARSRALMDALWKSPPDIAPLNWAPQRRAEVDPKLSLPEYASALLKSGRWAWQEHGPPLLIDQSVRLFRDVGIAEEVVARINRGGPVEPSRIRPWLIGIGTSVVAAAVVAAATFLFTI